MFSIDVMVVVRILIVECALVKTKNAESRSPENVLGGGEGFVGLLCVCVLMVSPNRYDACNHIARVVVNVVES